MQTELRQAQDRRPEVAVSGRIIRNCVHCGFCLATCPTYLLLGDELDSPRGRIYQIKEMLESGGQPSPETVKHVDRCLSCLACVTTCPSGVDYMHLVDHARTHIEQHHRRPFPERWLRALLAFVLTKPSLFRVLLRFAPLVRPFSRLLPTRVRAMFAMTPAKLPARDPSEKAGVFAAQGECRGRVALLAGCAQSVLTPQINAAAIRQFNRLGVEVVVAPETGCCGALPHHLGKVSQSHALAKANISAWTKLIEDSGIDAIVVTASGCGTTLKDYGYLFAKDPEWSTPAASVAALVKDVSEVLSGFARPPTGQGIEGLVVAYQSACSLQHGQQVRTEPVDLLREAGFTVVEPREQHICCGSAGTYNVLQPDIAGRLRDRKIAALAATGAQIIATGNVGCLTHLAGATALPVVHTVELLDWAAGGPRPAALDAPG